MPLKACFPFCSSRWSCTSVFAAAASGRSGFSFVLGGTGGDLTNVLTGSATGTLLAGHNYQFTYQGQIYAHFAGDSASASGRISLALAPVAAPVPVPAAVYGGAGMLGVLALFKVNRSRVAMQSSVG